MSQYGLPSPQWQRRSGSMQSLLSQHTHVSVVMKGAYQSGCAAIHILAILCFA